MNENKLIFVVKNYIYMDISRSFIVFLGLLNMQLATQSCIPKEQPASDLKVEKVSEIKAKLGEGSIWDYHKQVLYWVDIEEGTLFEYNPETDSTVSHFAGKKIGTIVPETDSTVVLALQDGVYRMFLRNDSLEFISKPSSLLSNQRFNDGKCDPKGRFWVGSMGPENSCFLYCLDNDGKITEVLDSITVSNGIIWSLDSTKMYYIDTRISKVRQFSFDMRDGSISNEKVIIEVPGNLGSPDGMTIDCEGKLWIAFWRGHGVYRYNPENGEIMQKIDLPAKNVTSCAFGGKDLDVLYITTSCLDMNEEELGNLPDAGKLFKVKTSVRGIKASFFKISK
jgi:sugar lactone lactonase YvrE